MTGPTVAVVDCDPVWIERVHGLLSDAGYQTIRCHGSVGAYGTIRQRRPDLVILDFRLDYPEAGASILGLLRLDPKTRRIPVLICSADVRLLHRHADLMSESCYALISKPVDADMLLAKVDELTQYSVARMGRAVGRPGGTWSNDG